MANKKDYKKLKKKILNVKKMKLKILRVIMVILNKKIGSKKILSINRKNQKLILLEKIRIKNWKCFS